MFYDDDSQDPTKATAIEGISEIKAGEYAIVLISNNPLDVAAFTTIWSSVINLSSIKIGYTDGAGLGAGGDMVTLWLDNPSTNSPMDTASYPATDNFDGLSYDVELASFSSTGNSNQAVQTTALGGDNSDVPNIASPGNQGPAIIDGSAPSIVVNVTNTTSFLTLSEESPAYVSGVLNDPTDPAATLGIHFTVSDADTPPEDLTVTVISNNQAVVLNENLQLSGTAADKIVKIIPTGIGYANITLTVTDSDSKTATYTIGYGASEAAVYPITSRYHTGTSDGSTAITTGTDYMWVADDENQIIRLYSTTNSGSPLKEINFNNDLGSSSEIDLEGSYRNGNNIYWMGSHTETSRSVIFGTVETENGIQSTLAYTGKYTNLRNDLISWDNNNGHGKGAKHYGLETTLEIEGFSIDPNNIGGALLALRAPLVEGKALLIPITNLETIITEGGSANFGSPIELDLESHSFRSIDCNEFGCVIIGGPVSNVTDFRLFTWNGNPEEKAELRAVDLMSRQLLGSYEGIAGIPSEPFTGTNGDNLEIQLLVDMGTFNFYNDGSEAKALPHAEWKKFKSDVVTFGPIEIPPVANEGDVVITEIMQNPAAVSDNNGEWFELYNTTFAPIDLNGWTISDNGSNTHTIDNGGTLIIAPGAYLVLGVNDDFTTNGGVTVNYTYDASFALGNSDDELILKASDGITIDSIAWDGGPNWPDPNGISMSLQNPNFDNNLPTNWCEATTTYGAGDYGTPGSANDCPKPPAAVLQITEIWSGNSVGENLTADWFEITNMGDLAWVSGVNPDLYYDDESQDPAIADIIMGISQIEAGKSVIIMIGDENDVLNFKTIWSPDYDLTDIEIGYTDGAGLGAGGDGVTLFLGTPSVESIVDFKTYPGVTSGSSYDLLVAGFSQSGVGTAQIGSNIAIATTASNGAQSAVGSPGNKGPLSKIEFDLKITEIFSGQAGSDLTADWFEIKNTGAAPWTLSSGSLYYDDESASATEATSIEGITVLQPNASAIVIIGTENDASEFYSVWSAVLDLTNIEIGYTSGAGLGGGGDKVVLWVGNPALSSPVDTASYPATDNYDGQSYDVELQAFSSNGNANNAVTTLALAGTNADVPNIGSPGNQLAISTFNFIITEIFSGQAGSDLTADWFEIKNTSDINWQDDYSSLFIL